jgi:hypothetical protein
MTREEKDRRRVGDRWAAYVAALIDGTAVEAKKRKSEFLAAVQQAERGHNGTGQ